MRKSIYVLGFVLVLAMGLFAYTVVQPATNPDSSQADAQDLSMPPVFANEVYEWCAGSCNGGNDEYSPNAPAEFTMRENGSLHFTTDVNFSACPSFMIPEGIKGWYFGTSLEQVQIARATAAAADEAATWQTTGVVPIDDNARNNPDLLICEAVFVRGE